MPQRLSVLYHRREKTVKTVRQLLLRADFLIQEQIRRVVRNWQPESSDSFGLAPRPVSLTESRSVTADFDERALNISSETRRSDMWQATRHAIPAGDA